MAHTPRGATLPVVDGAFRGVVFKDSDPLAGAPGLDCSQPGTEAAECHLPLSFPLKQDLPLALPLSGITWGGKVLAVPRADQGRQEHYAKDHAAWAPQGS